MIAVTANSALSFVSGAPNTRAKSRSEAGSLVTSISAIKAWWLAVNCQAGKALEEGLVVMSGLRLGIMPGSGRYGNVRALEPTA